MKWGVSGIWGCLLCILALGGNLVAGESTKPILESSLAGRWYSADKTALKKELNGYLKNARDYKVKNLMALILPHAGYRYSGQTAAYGIKLLKGKKYKRVIVLGPTHRVYMKNAVSVPDVKFYGTPLGKVPLDLTFIKKLRKEAFVRSDLRAHEYEHSVQIEVPLLQMVLSDFKLVPIVIGQLDMAAAKTIGKALVELVDDDTLVVASSDFTHYGPNFSYEPFHKDKEKNIKKLDMGAYEYIRKLDIEGFFKYVDKTRATICGRCSIGVLLAMLPKGTQVNMLKYDTSGRMLSDFSSSVSYLSVAFSGKWHKGNTLKTDIKTNGRKKMENEEKKSGLNEQDKKNLLALARKTIEYVFKHKTPPTEDDLDVDITPGMKQTMGAFVTLHKKGNLRGCIGEIVPRRELYKAVIDHAVNSAFRDYRFNQLQESELKEVDLEISALTPSKDVDSYNDIIIGKHGMTVTKDGRSAVFLPQVASEQGWNLAETLTHLSMKAGLSADAWKEPGATFTVFEAIVFGEKE